MAREATITQDEVTAVADRIRASGGRPTARAVRDDLGRGSMATVLRHLQTWQAVIGRASETAATLPPALQRALLDFVGQEVAAAKLNLEQDLVNAQQAQRDLIAENESQIDRIADLQTTLNRIQTERSQLEGRYAELQADLIETKHVAESQRHAAESARTEIAKLQLRLERVPQLEASVAHLREALDGERAARANSDRTAAVANARLEQCQASVEDLKARLARAENDSREVRHEADSTRKEVSQAKDEARRAEANAAELKGQLLAWGSKQPPST